jgi:hypothetical protein
MNKRCFVVQRFDGGRYDRLYDEVFQKAITRAGFDPYRVDRDPAASIPIDAIEAEITNADACFVEISEDAPNVWFELGLAIAKNKPICLVCSNSRDRFPFDIQHRQVIRYPQQPTPSEYDTLHSQIESRLKSIAEHDVKLSQRAEVAKALSASPVSSGLRQYELSALLIIFESHFDGGISSWSFKQAMERQGYIGAAASVAFYGLRRSGYADSRQEVDRDETYSHLFVTAKGEEWIVAHQDEFVFRNKPIAKSNEIEITDDDIPF